MSIAVSAIVRPSRLLRVLHAVLCAAVLALAWPEQPPWQRLLMLGAAMAGACWQCRAVKPVRIDISGVGQIRLTVYQHEGASCCVRLMPGSTLWPGLLLLRLQWQDDGNAPGKPADAGDTGTQGTEQGGVRWLAVLPDSVAPDVLRRLGLAVRAVAARQ